MHRRTFLGVTGTATAGLLGTGPRTATAFELEDDPLEEIEILIDEYGVSHVYADDLYSLSYGNGYVQARDRLFQMDAIRLVGRGESAEWLGPGQLSSDISNKRDLYTEEEIERQWQAAGETVRTVVQGFSDGINRQIAERAATGEIPGEFMALGRPPEPWQPTDTVAAIAFLIGRFGVGGGSEIGNAKTFNRLRELFDDSRTAFEAYEDLNWLETREDHYTTIPRSDMELKCGETTPDTFDDIPDEQLEYFEAADGAETWGIEANIGIPDDINQSCDQRVSGLFEGFKWGSNALAVSGELTESGNAILGGGPQMGTFKPPIPYEIGLHGAGIDMSGMGVAGAPGVIIGQTPDLAWTVTSGGDEHIDTIAVELDPDDRHRYKWEGEWYEMQTETVVHRPAAVGSALSQEARLVVQEVARIDHNGDEMPVVALNETENVAWVQRNSTRYDELEGAFIWAELAFSDDLDEFERRLSEFPFTFNFHAIDSEGNISYTHTGKLPSRPDDVDLRFPRTPELHEWTNISVGRGLGAHLRNTSTGYFINWNNRPVAGWPVGSGGGGGAPHEVEVLDHFVREFLDVPGEAPVRPETVRNELSRVDVAAIIREAAEHSAMAPYSIEFMIDVGLRADDPQLNVMADELRAWADTRCELREEDGQHMAGQGIWEEVRRQLEPIAFGEELGGDPSDLDFEPSNHAGDHGGGEDTTFYEALHLRTNHDWLGKTPQERDKNIKTAMKRAAENLEDRFDTADPSEWLIEARRTPFDLLGAAAPSDMPVSNRASYLLALEPATEFDPEAPKLGATLPPANSGHLSGPELTATTLDSNNEPNRLTNQLQLYIDYEYKPLPVSREAVEQVTVQTETLVATPDRPETARPGSADTDDGPERLRELDIRRLLGTATLGDAKRDPPDRPSLQGARADPNAMLSDEN